MDDNSTTGAGLRQIYEDIFLVYRMLTRMANGGIPTSEEIKLAETLLFKVMETYVCLENGSEIVMETEIYDQTVRKWLEMERRCYKEKYC